MGMLFLLRSMRRTRSFTRKFSHIASSAAILAGLCTLTVAHASFYTGGGIDAGITAAKDILGIGFTAPDVTINIIINQMILYVNLIAVAVIVIAGFYLILGLGSEPSRDTAKKIILYTAIGIAIIVLARDIVDLMYGLPRGTDAPGIRTRITAIINTATTYLALILVVVVVIAGFTLLLSGGDEGRRDTAKKIILYAIIGTIIIAFTRAIVVFINDILS